MADTLGMETTATQDSVKALATALDLIRVIPVSLVLDELPEGAPLGSVAVSLGQVEAYIRTADDCLNAARGILQELPS